MEETKYTVVLTTDGPWFPDLAELEGVVKAAAIEHTDHEARISVEAHQGVVRVPIPPKDENVENMEMVNKEAPRKKPRRRSDFNLNFKVRGASLEDIHTEVQAVIDTAISEIDGADSVDSRYADIEADRTKDGSWKAVVRSRIIVSEEEEDDDAELEEVF